MTGWITGDPASWQDIGISALWGVGFGGVFGGVDHLASQETPVEFGEGESKKPLTEAFKGLFSGLPDLVEFSELATKDKVAGQPEADAEFSEKRTDADRLAIHDKATALAAKEGTTVQELPYAALRKRLTAQGQVLELPVQPKYVGK